MNHKVHPDLTLLKKAVHEERAFVEAFFERLAERSRDPEGGITRDTYGPGENWGHKVMADAARESGLAVETDAAANTYVRWQAIDPEARTLLVGSHLDSVPRGGNFDGAAGALAGLVAIRALRKLGLQPAFSLAAMGIRAEESAWFQVSYIGSRSALGTLPADALDTARRIDTGRSLAVHMVECGAAPDRLRDGDGTLRAKDLVAFVEVHIEQAPTLLESAKALGICTGIPGNFRFPNARIFGRHDHVGTPRRFRHDAAVAGAVFAAEMDRLWEALDAEGKPLAVTFGRFHTDAEHHGLTVVPGLFHFSLDVRAYDDEVLTRAEGEMHSIIGRIEQTYRVCFDLGRRASAEVGRISPGILAGLSRSAERQGILHMPLGSPASHDAAAFATAGVPIGMLLVRNENGSHNPEETMEIGDFLDACTVLVDWLACGDIAAER